MFVLHSKTVILMKEGHQHDAEYKKVNKIQGFSKNFVLSGLRSDLC
jgi:hypothetical protein